VKGVFLKESNGNEKDGGVHDLLYLLFLGVPSADRCGVCGCWLQNWTQILNHVQLIMGYIRQGRQ